MLVYDAFYKPLQNVADKYFQARNYEAATLLTSSIQLYEKRYSSLPTDLSKLIETKILNTIPLDIWTGKPFKIDWQKRQINLKKPKSSYETLYGF